MNASISDSTTVTNRRADAHHRIDSSLDQEQRITGEAGNGSRKPRRRHIDPTTCERDYTIQEREFMLALDNYKQASGRMFPTCSEILEVIRDLGYIQYDLPSEPNETTAIETKQLTQ